MERACYYARVSTDEEKQVNALVKQCEEARQCIENMGWLLSGEYVDEGKSGTTIKKRDNYQALVADLETDAFDIVVIKSQDRLMRNVRDWYIFISTLIEKKKRLYFYLDAKFYAPDDALITGIKAILAEEYSRELSKKINNAQIRRIESGSSIITNGYMWGYTQKDGELYVDPEEAKVIHRIFELCASGLGCRRIKQIMDGEGVRSRRGSCIGLTTIKRMIRNPVYKGTVLMNKFHRDFTTKEITKNPESEWKYHEGRVEAIVDSELWAAANATMDNNSVSRNYPTKQGCRRNDFPLSGKIVCGECGRNYRHTVFRTKKGAPNPYWICATYQEFGKQNPRGKKITKSHGCDALLLKEENIDDVFRGYAQHLPDQIERYVEKANRLIAEGVARATIFDTEKARAEIEKTEQQRQFLLDKFLEGIVGDADYKKRNDALIRRQAELTRKIEESKIQCNDADLMREKLFKFSEYAKSDISTKARVKLIEKHVEKVTVYVDRLVVDLNLSRVVGDSISFCDPYETGSTFASRCPRSATPIFRPKRRGSPPPPSGGGSTGPVWCSANATATTASSSTPSFPTSSSEPIAALTPHPRRCSSGRLRPLS